MKKICILFLIATFLFSCNEPKQPEKEFSVPSIFADHMVIQRNKPIKVWGWGTSGEEVTIDFHQKKTKTIVNEQGKWQIELPAEKAGGPYDMTIVEKDTIIIHDILMGEVWLLSGQSNMQFAVGRSNHAKEALKQADLPEIRLYRVYNEGSLKPEIIHSHSAWHVCNPDSVKLFSAVGFYFGTALQKQIDVPVGLIQCAFGGSTVEAWIRADSLIPYGAFAEVVTAIKENTSNLDVEIDDKFLENKYNEKVSQWEDTMAIILENEKELDKEYLTGTGFENWETMRLPGYWEGQGLGGIDGVVWFTRNVEIPKTWKGKKLTLKLGAIDDIDVTWFNGVKVGNSFVYNDDRIYEVSEDIVNSTTCKISVKVIDASGGGGFAGPEGSMQLVQGNDSISLGGKWMYHVIFDELNYPLRPMKSVPQNIPTALYNRMLNPIIPFSLAGVVWYQGESNSDRPKQYNQLIKTMINNWRFDFRQEKLPFIIVQLPVWRDRALYPSESDWAELREAQFKATELPAVEAVCNIDLGEADDIHPTLKKPTGERVCLVALSEVYGIDTIFSGPRMTSVDFEDGKAIISFDHVHGGLVKKGSYDLKGFAIAGDDKKFVWADAIIEEDKVIASNPKVLNPVAIRYAWGDNPDCNLYNVAGLPAFPFRTDNWPGVPVKTEPEMNNILIELFK